MRNRPSPIFGCEFKTPFGLFKILATEKGLYSLRFGKGAWIPRKAQKRKVPSRIHFLLQQAARKIRTYLEGRKTDFLSFPIDWANKRPFERRVLDELRKVSWGKTVSYQFLAAKAGRPHAARAVGQIVHLNCLPIILPCHRITPKKGGLGGFSKGIGWKRRLLKLESCGADKWGEAKRLV